MGAQQNEAQQTKVWNPVFEAELQLLGDRICKFNTEARRVFWLNIRDRINSLHPELSLSSIQEFMIAMITFHSRLTLNIPEDTETILIESLREIAQINLARSREIRRIALEDSTTVSNFDDANDQGIFDEVVNTGDLEECIRAADTALEAQEIRDAYRYFFRTTRISELPTSNGSKMYTIVPPDSTLRNN